MKTFSEDMSKGREDIESLGGLKTMFLNFLTGNYSLCSLFLLLPSSFPNKVLSLKEAIEQAMSGNR